MSVTGRTNDEAQQDDRFWQNVWHRVRTCQFSGWWDVYQGGPFRTEEIESWIKLHPEAADEHYAVIRGNRATFTDHVSNGMELAEIYALEADPWQESPARLLPEILLQTSIINLGNPTTEGKLVTAVTTPWLDIVRRLKDDHHFLFHFAKYPRKFEEFIAGAYRRAGWPIVELTPSSNDKGRDVIATKPGFLSVRVIDQVKAYSPHSLVTHNDIRAMLGVLQTDPNVSKAIITTTSSFQPGILRGDEFSKFLPYRLELRDGDYLREWLLRIYNDNLPC